MSRKILIISALLLLSACSKESADSSTTKLDAVEVENGSISDAMITLDQAASDGTAIDSSVPADTSQQAQAKPADADESVTSAAESAAGDTVISPPVSNTPMPTPAPVTK